MSPRASRATRQFLAVACLFALTLALGGAGRLVAQAPMVNAVGGALPTDASFSPPLDKAPPLLEPLLNGTCLACPAFNFGCFTPAIAFTLDSSSTSGAGDCNWYCFNVVSGTTYEFTTCAPGSGTFDTTLTLVNPAACAVDLAFDDDSCATQSFISWTATFSGPVHLKVAGFGAGSGNYTLAYRRLCAGDDCSRPFGALATPTTSCQLQVGAIVDCAESTAYTVVLEASRIYTFTLCPSTCAGADAAFDSRLELWRGAALQVANTDFCGDDGQVTFATAPLTGAGTYCVKVNRQAGASPDFTLGWFVECEVPANVAIVPIHGGATTEDCTLEQTFTATTTGTGPFAYSWTIVPPVGGSATPSMGTVPNAGNSSTFTSLLQGDGDYGVSVSVMNLCGTAGAAITYALEDRIGPALTTTAVPGGACITRAKSLPQQRLRRSRAGERLADLDRDEMAELVYSAEDPEDVEAAIARKLGIAKALVHVIDGDDPAYRTPPGAAALTCMTPCTTGTLTQLHPFYDIAVDCDDGDFTAGTGANHPVTLGPPGTRQNVIYGGANLQPGTSDTTFYVHDTATTYTDPAGGSACTFDPPDTPGEQDSIGIEQEWTKSPGPGRNLLLRQELVAFGTTDSDSGIRLTLGVTNLPTSTLPSTLGVRWQVDYQNAIDDGPLYAQVACGPPLTVTNERFTEHLMDPNAMGGSEIGDFYRIQNNTGTPIFGNFSSTTELGAFPDTGTPDRLIYGRWGTLTGAAWGYLPNEGANADSDSAVLYYFGFALADGITLAPGQSFRRSVIIFTAGEDQDCGARRPGTCNPSEVTICQDSCATVGATAIDGCGTAGVQLVDATVGAPPCVGNPCTAVYPDLGTYIYTWEAEDEAGNTVTCTSTVHVVDVNCNLAPLVDAGPDETRGCDDGLQLAATASDPDLDPLLIAWTSNCGATFSDATVLDPVVTFGSSCNVTCTLTVSVDDGRGGTASDSLDVIVNDLTPPMVVAAFVPAPPAPPTSAAVPASPRPPAAPGSACSVPSSATLVVVCGASEDCGAAPSVTARILVTNHDVPVRGGACVLRVDAIDVECGDVVLVRLVAPPCPARAPRSALASTGVTSAGGLVITGESVVLEVTATNDCGVSATATADPTLAQTPPCDEPLPDGTCCPLVAAPAAPRCPGGACP